MGIKYDDPELPISPVCITVKFSERRKNITSIQPTHLFPAQNQPGVIWRYCLLSPNLKDISVCNIKIFRTKVHLGHDVLALKS